MIASLAGVLARKGLTGLLVIEVGGVGYRVFVPLSTLVALPPEGERVRLEITTIVREDDISLYGFSTVEEQELFELLGEVNGVGPKLALKILSGLDPDRLGRAIGAGDVAQLTTISGVGKKLAQRLVVELKDKIGPVFEGAHAPSGTAKRPSGSSEAAEALVALGYPQKTARDAVAAVEAEAGDETLATGELVRRSLQLLAPKR